MPLNRPAQALTPGPRGVSDARRWAAQVLHEIDRPELVEAASISVSEVITNALLHAEQPVSVRLRGTREHPRIEVRDGSRQPPDLPDLDGNPEDDVLLTFGRGLSIVARVSSAWGADIDEEGKTVWFVPRVELAEGRGVQGIITELQPLQREDPPRRRPRRRHPDRPAAAGDEVQPDAPARAAARAPAAGDGARGHYPLAASLSRFFAELDATFWRGLRDERLSTALLDDDDELDLTITVPRAAGDDFQRFIELLELADAFCRQERLLTLARTPEQVNFQTWMFGEFVRQTHGADALPWRTPGQQ